MPGPLLMVGGSLVAAIVAVEAWLLGKAWRCVRRDLAGEIAEVEARLLLDIDHSARRGFAPDWGRYRDELDRLYEPLDERLKNLASAALASGLGGTILTLIAHALVFLPASGDFDVSPRQVILGIGVGLSGSFAGVVSNLIITLGYLPRLEERFEAATRPVWQRLRDASHRRPATEAFVETLQQEMVELRGVLGSEVGDAFKAAIGQFPDILGSLNSQLEELSRVVQAQGENVKDMITTVDESARNVKESSELLAPAIRPLVEFSEKLTALPGAISEVLIRQEKVWVEDLDQRHEERFQQLSSLVEDAGKQERAMKLEINDLVRVVDAIPEKLRESIERGAGTFSDRFQFLAGEHLEALKEFSARNEEEWHGKIARVVEDLLRSAQRPIEDNLVPRIEDLGDKLTTNAEMLSEAGKEFNRYHQAWLKSQDEQLASWVDAAIKIEGAATSLGESEGHLRRAAGALEGSAETLDGVTEIQGAFEEKLRASLAGVTESYIQEIHSVLGEMKKRSERYDAVLKDQSRVLIEALRTLDLGSDGSSSQEVDP